MPHSRRTYLLLALLLIASFACAIPSVTFSDTNTINTAVAQTVSARLTQNAPQQLPPSGSQSTFTPTVTFVPLDITATLFPTITLSPQPLFTNTPIVPIMSVSVSTNCRSGPGKVYDLQGALLVGETAEVYGRDPTSRYWFIRNPDSGADFCWAWGEYATISGSTQLLPVFTPPPTPTPTITPTPSPSFDLDYSHIDSCSGWWVDIAVINTGSQSFKSVTFEIQDQVTKVELIANSDVFTNLDGCLKTSITDTLNSGGSLVISSPLFKYDPTGHDMLAFVTFCTEDGQKGACITKKIKFKP